MSNILTLIVLYSLGKEFDNLTLTPWATTQVLLFLPVNSIPLSQRHGTSAQSMNDESLV